MREDAGLLSLNLEEGALGQGMLEPGEVGKGKETSSALHPPGGTRPS